MLFSEVVSDFDTIKVYFGYFGPGLQAQKAVNMVSNILISANFVKFNPKCATE